MDLKMLLANMSELMNFILMRSMYGIYIIPLVDFDGKCI